MLRIPVGFSKHDFKISSDLLSTLYDILVLYIQIDSIIVIRREVNRWESVAAFTTERRY